MNLRQKHSSHISWFMPTNAEHQTHIFSSSLYKHVIKTEEILKHLGYTIVHEPITPSLLEAFWGKYSAFLEHKPRGKVFPIKELIEKNTAEGKQYTILSLYNPTNTFVGGLILSEDHARNRITTAYKVLPHSLPEKKRFPESLAYVFTFRFYAYALEKKYPLVFHGMDRNPYGVYSNIGLGLFKIRAGCTPHVSRKEKITYKEHIDYQSNEDMLIWLGDTPEMPVTHAILITKLTPDEAKEKYKPLFLLKGVTVDIWDHATYTTALAQARP